MKHFSVFLLLFLYDVIPHEKAMKIIEELNLQNSSPYQDGCRV
jgi:hypothetical protein|nr:hypothetical protein [Prevotella sp.]